MLQAIIYDKDAGLRQGISQAGSALGQAVAQRSQVQRADQQRQQQMEQQQRYGSILSETMSNLPQDATNMQMVGAFNNALSQGVPMEMMQGLSTLSKTIQSTGGQGGLGIDNKDELVDLFSRFGMESDQAQREADLYTSLSQGGKTQYANFFFDRMQRGQLGAAQPTGQQSNLEAISIEGPQGQNITEVEETEVQGYEFPEVDMFEGVTSKEKVGIQKELFNANAKEYAEIGTKKRGYEDELRRLSQMGKLNDSGRLPQGLDRLNINWTTGDIRLPAAANAETQAFVKMVNDFTTKAKDTYGARVTNFELGTFMRRLPTLANSEEGRRLILSQMEVNAGIEMLYQDSLAEVYDKYGLRGIDSQKADVIARDLRKDDEKALLKRYDESMKAQEVYEAKTMAPEGKVPVMSPDGQVKYIWRHQADKAEKRGYRIL